MLCIDSTTASKSENQPGNFLRASNNRLPDDIKPGNPDGLFMLCIDMSIVHLKFGSTRLETNSSQGEIILRFACQETECKIPDGVDAFFGYRCME